MKATTARVVAKACPSAAVFTAANQPLQIRQYPLLPPARGEVLLKLLASGICGTDVHIAEGRLAIPGPFVPGHEFVGRVEALGAGVKVDGLGSALKAGDAAIACVALACGHCFSCQQGHTASCLNFGVTYVKDPAQTPHFHGGYGEYLHQPARTLVKIPGGVAVEAAAALPCAGPTVIRAMDFAGNLEAGELVVVQGTGPVGLFAIAWAAAAGCTVVAIGSGASPQRQKAARALGAKQVLDYRGSDAEMRRHMVLKLAKRLGRSNGADVVVEASGSPQALPEGLSLLRTLGRYIIPGQYSNSGTVAIAPELITFKALKIIGSGQYKMSDIQAYLLFLKRHPDLATKLSRLVTRFPLGEAQAAMEAVSAGKVVKAVLV